MLEGKPRPSSSQGHGEYVNIGNVLQLNKAPFHHILAKWHKTYGPVYKIRLLSREFVIVSSYDALHEALVEKGIATGGRSYGYYREEYLCTKRGITTSEEPNDTWRTLRKLTQRHLKQFGDGMSRLEAIIEETGNGMLDEFAYVASKPFDPQEAVDDAAGKTIAILIGGWRPANMEDPLLKLIQKYKAGFLKYIVPIATPKIMMYDWIPWLRHFNLKTWQEIRGVRETGTELWELVKKMAIDHPENESLARLLFSHCGTPNIARPTGSHDENQGHVSLDELDAEAACLNLLVAGIVTTSCTFYSLINILAHNSYIQEAIWNEMLSVSSSGEITLKSRPRMPYTRAFIYEVLRYTSPVPLSVLHRATQDVDISGYNIPKGTQIQPNLWALHHDPDFWRDPENFRPERFLDDLGELIPADHERRKHLMPFGAGTRLCLGEPFALARLFIWTARLIQRFRIVPASGNDASLISAHSYQFRALSYSVPYDVIFTPRPRG